MKCKKFLKAQVWVETAVYTIIGLAIIGIILAIANPSIQRYKDNAVIEQTIRQKLPEGFQRSEFLLEHGLIDMIVHRKNLKSTLSQLLDYLS